MNPEEKKDIEMRRSGLDQDVQAFLRQVRDANKNSRDGIQELHRNLGLYVVGIRVDGIREQHAGFPKVVAYLNDVQEYILSHLEDFTEDAARQESPVAAGERNADNLYPEGTVNYRVEQRLKQFSEILRKLGKEEESFRSSVERSDKE